MTKRVSSKWVAGNLVFFDYQGNTLATFNGTTGKFVMAAGTVDSTQIADDTLTSDQMDPNFIKMVRGALTAGNANAFAFAIANPENATLLIHKVLLNVSDAGGTAGALIDVGVAANGTTASDILIDGADINAVALYDNVTDKGTNGKTRQKWGATEYVTGRILVQNAATLNGRVYIYYTKA